MIRIRKALIASHTAHGFTQGWNCRGGWTPSPGHVHRPIFEWKSALNFNPWAKFQTFRHLTWPPSSFRSIPTLVSPDKTLPSPCLASSYVKWVS